VAKVANATGLMALGGLSPLAVSQQANLFESRGPRDRADDLFFACQVFFFLKHKIRPPRCGQGASATFMPRASNNLNPALTLPLLV
jgi:hypothetical protein